MSKLAYEGRALIFLWYVIFYGLSECAQLRLITGVWNDNYSNGEFSEVSNIFSCIAHSSEFNMLKATFSVLYYWNLVFLITLLRLIQSFIWKMFKKKASKQNSNSLGIWEELSLNTKYMYRNLKKLYATPGSSVAPKLRSLPPQGGTEKCLGEGEWGGSTTWPCHAPTHRCSPRLGPWLPALALLPAPAQAPSRSQLLLHLWPQPLTVARIPAPDHGPTPGPGSWPQLWGVGGARLYYK